MKETSNPDFAKIELELNKKALNLHPSQVHGVIAGLLCGPIKPNANWQELVTGGQDIGKSAEILQELFDHAAQELKEFSFEFQLLLPDDEQSLSIRAEALTLWTQGFLTGLKIAQIPIEGREESDVTDAVNDLIEIAKMNYEDVVANEEDETAYIDLVEYVRMATIMIYQSLHENDATAQKATSSKQLH